MYVCMCIYIYIYIYIYTHTYIHTLHTCMSVASSALFCWRPQRGDKACITILDPQPCPYGTLPYHAVSPHVIASTRRGIRCGVCGVIAANWCHRTLRCVNWYDVVCDMWYVTHTCVVYTYTYTYAYTYTHICTRLYTRTCTSYSYTYLYTYAYACKCTCPCL